MWTQEHLLVGILAKFLLRSALCRAKHVQVDVDAELRRLLLGQSRLFQCQRGCGVRPGIDLLGVIHLLTVDVGLEFSLIHGHVDLGRLNIREAVFLKHFAIVIDQVGELLQMRL